MNCQLGRNIIKASDLPGIRAAVARASANRCAEPRGFPVVRGIDFTCRVGGKTFRSCGSMPIRDQMPTPTLLPSLLKQVFADA
jgi:hypothetical protein